MRNKFVIISLAVLAAFAIACGSATTGSSVTGNGQTGTANGNQGPATAAIGQTITLTDSSTSVTITLANAKQYTSNPNNSFDQPQNGVYVVVNATIVCTKGTYDVNPVNFKFVGGDGSAYDPGIAVGFDPMLNLVTLNPGQKSVGNIVFDVTQAAVSGAKIQVDGIGLDYNQPAAYWTL
jgi:hypothetical protein